MEVGHSCAWWVPQPQSWELQKSHPPHSECRWLLHSRVGLEAARWDLQHSESEVLLVFLHSQAVNRKPASSVTSAETEIYLILGQSENDVSVQAEYRETCRNAAFSVSATMYSSTNSPLFNQDIEFFILVTVCITAGGSKAWGKLMLLLLPLHRSTKASSEGPALNNTFSTFLLY